jgi:hypothetical protein
MSALPIVLGVLAAAGVWLLAMGIVAARAGDATMLARQRLARQEIGLGQSAVALELENPSPSASSRPDGAGSHASSLA